MKKLISILVACVLVFGLISTALAANDMDNSDKASITNALQPPVELGEETLKLMAEQGGAIEAYNDILDTFMLNRFALPLLHNTLYCKSKLGHHCRQYHNSHLQLRILLIICSLKN